MKQKLRITAIVASIVALLSFAASTQASAKDIDSARAVAVVQTGPNTVADPQIKTQGIGSTDYGLGSIFGSAIRDNTIPEGKLGADIRNRLKNADVNRANAINSSNQIAPGTIGGSDLDALLDRRINMPQQTSQSGQLVDPVVLQNVGGSIFGDYNVAGSSDCSVIKRCGTLLPNVAGMLLDTHAPDAWGVPLKHNITVYGEFEFASAPASATVQVQPQLSLWLDKDGDKVFEAGEGIASPNATMVSVAGRHTSVSATIPYLDFSDVTAETVRLYVVAMAYDSAGGTNGEGQLTLKNMRISDEVST